MSCQSGLRWLHTQLKHTLSAMGPAKGKIPHTKAGLHTGRLAGVQVGKSSDNASRTCSAFLSLSIQTAAPQPHKPRRSWQKSPFTGGFGTQQPSRRASSVLCPLWRLVLQGPAVARVVRTKLVFDGPQFSAPRARTRISTPCSPSLQLRMGSCVWPT